MRSLTLVLLFILSISAANSQSETDELTNTLLWEVTHPISKVSSYIFGTIHLIPEDKFNISDSLTHCINRVDEIFFEIDLSGMEDLGNLHTLLSKMIMKNDTLISDLLPEDKSTLLFQKLNERGIPPFIVEKIKPIFISMILESPSLTDNKEGEDALNMKSYEIELNAMAVEMGKEIKGLETIEEQIDLFDNIPYALQAEMLLDNLNNDEPENLKNIDHSLFDLYKAQDLNEINKMMNADSDLSGFNHILLDKRNIDWVNSIIKLDNKQSYLFAVGAGHLPGANGIIQLLKNEGYQFRPMQNH